MIGPSNSNLDSSSTIEKTKSPNPLKPKGEIAKKGDALEKVRKVLLQHKNDGDSYKGDKLANVVVQAAQAQKAKEKQINKNFEKLTLGSDSQKAV